MLCHVGGRQLAHKAAVGVDHDAMLVCVADGAAHTIVEVEQRVVSPAGHAVSDPDRDGAVVTLLG
jgi:hypothetical protein